MFKYGDKLTRKPEFSKHRDYVYSGYPEGSPYNLPEVVTYIQGGFGWMEVKESTHPVNPDYFEVYVPSINPNSPWYTASGFELARLKKENEELKKSLFLKQNPHCGMSWNGFALEGNRESVRELERLMNCEARLLSLEEQIKKKELVYAKES